MRCVQTLIEAIEDWADRWRFEISAAKTIAVRFTKRKTVPDSRIDLRVTLGDGLTFRPHVLNTRTRFCASKNLPTSFLSQQSTLEAKSKLLLYNTRMRLVLTYEALALSVMTAMYFSTLEAIQNRTFWQMVGAPWLVKNQQILQKTSFKDFMLDLIARNSSNLLVAWLVDPQDWPPTRIRVGGESWESPGSPGLYGKIP